VLRGPILTSILEAALSLAGAPVGGRRDVGRAQRVAHRLGAAMAAAGGGGSAGVLHSRALHCLGDCLGVPEVKTRSERCISTEILWKWIDAHGKEFGIGRPYLG
jgi:hypothetical protein